jgi:hypothetical protein
MFPIFIVLAAIAVAGGGGCAIEGFGNMGEAEHIAKRAKEKHKKSLDALQKAADDFNRRAARYGERKIFVYRDVIAPILEAFPGLKTELKKKYPVLEKIEILANESAKNISFDKGDMGITGGVVSGVFTGASLTAGTYAAVGMLANAGTGAAISALSGAAARSATLAWIGGGTLASGGAGVAGGSLLLGSIAIVPAVLFAGLNILKKGEEALTEARKFEADVDVEVSTHDLKKKLLGGAVSRVDEMEGIFTKMATSTSKLHKSVKNNYPALTQKAREQLFQMVLAVCEIMTVPILTEKHETTQESERVYREYKEW